MPFNQILKNALGATNLLNKYLGKLETDNIKQVEMKEKKRVSQTNEEISLSQDSHQMDKNLGCPSGKILRTIVEMDEGRTSINGPNNKKVNDQITRRLMTMHKALHPRDDIDRLYISRKEGEKEHAR